MEKFIEMYGDKYFEQLELESQYRQLGMDKMRQNYDRAREDETMSETGLGQKFINHHYGDVFVAVKDLIDTMLAPKRGVKPSYYLIVQDMAAIYKDKMNDLYALLSFGALSVLFDNTGNKKELLMSNVGQWIAKAYVDEANLTKYTNEHPDRMKSVLTGIDKRVQASYRRNFALACMRRDGYTGINWNAADVQQLAISVVNLIVDNTPYFEHNTYGTTLAVQPTQALLDAWAKNEDNIVNNSYRLCPTIIPPRPWNDYAEGGYYGELQRVSTLLRIHDQRTYFGKRYLQKLGQLEMSEVRTAINGIQETPWRINKQVLEVVQHLVATGGNKAGLPCMDIPPKPIVLSEDPTEEEIKNYKEVMVAYYKDETRRKSLALRALSNVHIAEKFKDYPEIYFPHNLDFRGRVYPISGNGLSPQGDDLGKGLLLFANVPPCDSEEDIKWLMVHGANLAGVDKVSYADRHQWVLDNEQNILASASDPLGYLWWADQDCPVQMLSWCFEWAKWKEYEALHGTAVGFVTGMQIAFDGTCSGIQHFSAALRDPVGAAAVNIVPSEKPSDIYGIVADKVNVMLKEELKIGSTDEATTNKKGEATIKYGTKTLAQLWMTYGVTRKVTKRSVMTLAYGSKEYGFRDQILEDVIEADIHVNKKASVFNQHNKYQASAYMAKLIWNSVNTTVIAAVEGMKWLQECAKLVTKDGQVVTWTTAMGLPVQQSYMECETTKVRLRCAGKRLNIFNLTLTGNIDKRGQAQGIAPNFIHSCDAAHLQLSAKNGIAAGIKHWAMIHDSYAAPISQGKLLYRIIRESFVQMYTEHDVFAEFKADMEKLTTERLPEPPKKGELDITQIMQSEYIFS